MSQYYAELADSAVLRKRERGILRIALLLYVGIPGLDFKSMVVLDARPLLRVNDGSGADPLQ